MPPQTPWYRSSAFITLDVIAIIIILGGAIFWYYFKQLSIQPDNQSLITTSTTVTGNPFAPVTINYGDSGYSLNVPFLGGGSKSSGGSNQTVTITGNPFSPVTIQGSSNGGVSVNIPFYPSNPQQGGGGYALPTCSLSASPTSINSGDPATLSWSTSNATSIQITPNIGVGQTQVSGSQTVSPSVTTVYTLLASGEGGTVSCNASVEVNSNPPPAPPICSFSASPTSVSSGNPSTLTWTSSNATSAAIVPNVGTVPTSGSTSVTPTQSTLYTLTVTGPGGSVTCTTTVTVTGGGQPPARLTIRGSQIIDPSGNPIILRGFNWGDWGSPLAQDATDNIAQGANYVRIPLSWYFGSGTGATDCGTTQDSYDPQSPQTGYINPANLAIVDQEVQWASSAHLWVNLMVRGGDCDFWTNPTIIPQYLTMWAFLANHYKNTPYIGSYEILSEPHPTTLHKVPNEAIVKALAIKNIASIRTIDPRTPIVVGPAQTYDIRNISTAYMPGVANIIYTANFFELPAYVKSEKGAGPDNGYPGSYVDANNKGTFACTYPNEGLGNAVTMDKTWLAGLLTCATSFRDQYNVPVYINQVGLFTSTIDAKQYVTDVLGLFNQNNISWTWWTYRQRPANSDPTSQAIIYKDNSGTWQTKQDWLTLISSFF